MEFYAPENRTDSSFCKKKAIKKLEKKIHANKIILIFASANGSIA